MLNGQVRGRCRAGEDYGFNRVERKGINAVVTLRTDVRKVVRGEALGVDATDEPIERAAAKGRLDGAPCGQVG